jgi:hypothetical protein
MSIAFHPLPRQCEACEACGIGDCVTVPVLVPGLNVIRVEPVAPGRQKI